MAKTNVAAGLVYSSTMLNFLPALRAASPHGGRADGHLGTSTSYKPHVKRPKPSLRYLSYTTNMHPKKAFLHLQAANSVLQSLKISKWKFFSSILSEQTWALEGFDESMNTIELLVLIDDDSGDSLEE